MIYAIVAIWVLCGVLAYGQSMGNHKEEFEPVLGVKSSDVVFSFITFLAGPVGLISMVITDKSLMGKFWYTPSWQFRTGPPTDPMFRDL